MMLTRKAFPQLCTTVCHSRSLYFLHHEVIHPFVDIVHNDGQKEIQANIQKFLQS